METIRDLHGVWRAQAGSFGIGPSTVAADQFRWGMIAQPLGDGVGLAIGQNIHHAAELQITRIRP